MDLSLCMIVKNEAGNLPQCLASVQDVVDEMIVLDTGSTDATCAIAQEFGAIVPSFEWCHDFSIARNHALGYVKGDWVLVLDADERLNPDVVPVLKQAIQQPDALVINLVRHEIGAMQSPYSLVSRLFRRHPALKFSRPYHAMIDDSVAALLRQESHWKIINIPDIAILHYGYEPGAIATRNKLNQARLMMERYLITHPGDPYVCNKLGALYLQLGRLQHGVELLERGIRAKQLDPTVHYELHYHLGIAYTRLEHISQAAEQYRLALQQPILARLKLGAYNNLAGLRQSSGDLLGAKMIYEQLLKIEPGFAIAHYNLGMVLKGIGQLQAAVEAYQRAIALDPSYAEAYQNLGVVLLKLGHVPASLEAFRQAILLHQQRVPQEAERLRKGLQELGFEV